VNAITLPAEKRSPAQSVAIAVSDALVDELLAADVLVLAVPMYNFGVPSSLKAWIDRVVRAGRTFAYNENGPQGLATGKKAIVVLARGGVYSDGPMRPLDYQESYLRSVLGFIGITNVKVVRVEGVGMGEEAIKKALTSAKAQTEEAASALVEVAGVKRALYLATALFMPGGLIAVPLLWWLERRKAPAAPHPDLCRPPRPRVWSARRPGPG
jgi:FMN-dependent NADH-azoreductase